MLKTLPDRVSPVVPLQASKLEQRRAAMIGLLCLGRSFYFGQRTELCVKATSVFAELMKPVFGREGRLKMG